MRDTLIVLVREGHRQKEGALLGIISNVILMDWKRDGFRTVKMHWFFQALVGADNFSFPHKQGTRIPNPAPEESDHAPIPLGSDRFRNKHVTNSGQRDRRRNGSGSFWKGFLTPEDGLLLPLDMDGV